MTRRSYRFEFETPAVRDEAELTLHLAMYAAEGLFGRARVCLALTYRRDGRGRSLLLTSRGAAGTAVVRIFAGLLLRELGETAFRMYPIVPNDQAA